MSKEVPVIVDGKQVGTIPLESEYRILLQGMIMGAQADIDFATKRLAELDAMFKEQKDA